MYGASGAASHCGTDRFSSMMTTMCLYGFVEAWTVPHGCAPVASAAAGLGLGAAAADGATTNPLAHASSARPSAARQRRASHLTAAEA